MNLLIPVLTVLLILQAPLNAQVQTAHHRKVYAEINAKTDTYKTVTADLEVEHAAISLRGWSDGGELRKIVATVGGEHGTGVEEYYIENNRLLFLHTVYTTEDLQTGEVVNRSEGRCYFKDGAMIKYLKGKMEPFEPGSKDFNVIANSITADFANYKGILEKKSGAKAAATQTVGKFTGIEEGDYSHWNMTSGNGEEVSFFILNGGESVAKVLENPDAFTGRKCRVKSETSLQEIPEAGGKVEITQITGVEWLE